MIKYIKTSGDGLYEPPTPTTEQATIQRVLIESDPVFELQYMTSPPTITVSGTATLPKYWPATSFAVGHGSGNLTGEYFNYVKAGHIMPNGDSSNFVVARNIKRNATEYSRSNWGVLFYHTGANVEIRLNFINNNLPVMFKVNGKYTSATTYTLTSGIQVYKLAFGSRARRKIECIMCGISTIIVGGLAGVAFGGVYTETGDTIEYCPAEGVRTVIVGDSYASGTGATNMLQGLSALYGDYLGWDDVIFDAIGGTSYIATNGGLNYNYLDRLQHNVVDLAPQKVVVTGGFNDFGLGVTEAQVYAAAIAYFKALTGALPSVYLVVCSPFFNTDASKFKTAFGSLIGIRDGIKRAALEVGAEYIDLMENDLPHASPVTGTLAASHAANATTFQSATFFPAMSTVEIGNTVRNRAVIGSIAGGGPWTYTLLAGTINDPHAAGETIRQVGGSLWTGTGKVGSATGIGNCDVLVAADGHPSNEGHSVIASAMITRILQSVKF